MITFHDFIHIPIAIPLMKIYILGVVIDLGADSDYKWPPPVVITTLLC